MTDLMTAIICINTLTGEAVHFCVNGFDVEDALTNAEQVLWDAYGIHDFTNWSIKLEETP